MLRWAAILGMAIFAMTMFVDRAEAQETFAEMRYSAPDAAPPTPIPEILLRLPRVPDLPRSLFQQATDEHSHQSPISPEYFEADPLLDRPELPQSGFFAAMETQLAAPHIYKFLYGNVAAGTRPADSVNLPNRNLNWTAAPRIELGYRLPSGFGGFALSYRTLGTSGDFSTAFLGPDGPATLHSRLNLNVVDLDYISNELKPWDSLEMRWRIGGRFASLYYDTVLNQTMDVASAGSGILQQHATNSFNSFGPHVGVELRWHLDKSGLSILSRVDYGAMLGRIKQGFYETALDPNSPGGVGYGQNVASSSQTIQMASILTGLNWQPPRFSGVDFFAGYQYDYWYNVGRASFQPGSRGEMSLQGLVIRLTYNY